MNYLKIYESLISRAKERILDGYVERHHVLPRCMGGSDDSSNIIVLTAEEHYLAHQLLVKIYPENAGLVFAAQFMTTGPDGRKNNNKSYGWIRKKIAEIMTGREVSKETREKLSKKAKGRISNNKGKPMSEDQKKKISNAKKGKPGSRTGAILSDETKAKMSRSLKGKTPRKGVVLSEETKMKISESLKGFTHSEESKKKMSESRTGKKRGPYKKKMKDGVE